MSSSLYQNNATCSVTSFSDTYECRCLAGFSGEHCETNDDDCASQPCLHGGICQDGIRNYTCNCGGTGLVMRTLCEKVWFKVPKILTRFWCLEPCGSWHWTRLTTDNSKILMKELQKCQTCQNSIFFYRYEGMRCGDNIDECALLIPCQNGATCYDLYGDYECACVPGYSGKHCELVSHFSWHRTANTSHPCIPLWFLQVPVYHWKFIPLIHYFLLDQDLFQQSVLVLGHIWIDAFKVHIPSV